MCGRARHSVSEFNALCVSLAVKHSDRRNFYDERASKNKLQATEQKLVFQSRALHSIPETIFFLNLRHLTSIMLVDIRLATVPDQIGLHFPNLETLSFDVNNLTSLPKMIGNLKNLKKLSFRKNNIKELPITLQCLLRLQCLDASFNQIEEIPSLEMPFLSELLLENNLICKFTFDSKEFKSLKILNLSNNLLEVFLGDLPAMERLTTLYLQHNNLNKIPELLTKLEKISELDVSCNIINVLPTSLKSKSVIKRLHINCNKIRRFPQWFFQLSNVEKLSFYCNPIEFTSISSFNMDNYSFLESINSQFTDDMCHEVELPYKILPDLPYLNFPENIKDLNLSGIKLRTLPDSIGYMKFLKELYLSDNLISQLPETFCYLTSLEYFHISSNKLQTLPDSFGAMSSLQTFLVNNNYLSNLPESFSKLKNLRYLDLVGNKFKLFPAAVLLLSNISYLKIESELANSDGQYSNVICRALQLVRSSPYKSGECMHQLHEEDGINHSVELHKFSESSEDEDTVKDSLNELNDNQNGSKPDLIVGSENWDDDIEDMFCGYYPTVKYLSPVFDNQGYSLDTPAPKYADFRNSFCYCGDTYGQFSNAD